MNKAILALDTSRFKHFNYALQIVQKYPVSLQSDKSSVKEIYSNLVEMALTTNERRSYKLTAEEILKDIEELHAEYLEIMAAFELAERGEQHEAPTTNTVGQAYREAFGGYEPNTDLAL